MRRVQPQMKDVGGKMWKVKYQPCFTLRESGHAVVEGRGLARHSAAPKERRRARRRSADKDS